MRISGNTCQFLKSLGKQTTVDLILGYIQSPHRTLTTLSQPQETMMGLLLLGEKRTQETHSVWLSSWKWKMYINNLKVWFPTSVIYWVKNPQFTD